MHKQSTSKKHGNKKWRTEDNPRAVYANSPRTPKAPPRAARPSQGTLKTLRQPMCPEFAVFVSLPGFPKRCGATRWCNPCLLNWLRHQDRNPAPLQHLPRSPKTPKRLPKTPQELLQDLRSVFPMLLVCFFGSGRCRNKATFTCSDIRIRRHSNTALFE